MERNVLKKDEYTAEYLFAKDIVRKVIEMRCIYMLKFRDPELDNAFSTVEKKLLSMDWKPLDEYITRITNRNGRRNFGDRRFLRCIGSFIIEYKPELQSKDEFLLVCSKIVYAAERFLRNNDQSDAIAVAVDRVYQLLIDTFYSTMINEEGPLTKFVRDQKYCLAYDVVKKLFKLRGTRVPDLELLYGNDCLFSYDRIEIENMLNKEQSNLNKLLKSFTCKGGKFDYSNITLLRCMKKIEDDYGFKKNTIEEWILLCARIAYTAAWVLRENSISNVIDLAVNRIFHIAKELDYFNKFKQDIDYFFSYDLVSLMVEMISNSFSFAEMSHPGTSFFMIAHRNKIEDHLSKEKFHLDEVVRKFTGEDESSGYKDDLFLSILDEILDDYKPDNKTREGLVHACARIAYVAACFLSKNRKSNAPGLAVDRMLKIVKDINRVPKSEEVLILRPPDDHYRFAYDLVKAVLEMMNIPVQETDPPDADNLLFTTQHRKKIENILLKRLPELDIVKILNLCFESSDFNDSTFIQFLKETTRDEYDKKTEEGLLFISVTLAYLSGYFIKQDCQSTASFLATNRIYELIKDSNCFCDSKEERILIVNMHDDHYLFAHDLTITVLKMKDIPVSPLVLPELYNRLFTDAHRNKIQDLIREEKFQLDEMIEKLVNISRCMNYSDNEFLHCMNQIVLDYESDLTTGKGFVYVCGRIAYTAAFFLIKNCKSKAAFLAMNRMYEMSKNAFCNKNEEDCYKEEKYNFAYDLVTAVLRIINNSSFKIHMPDPDVSPFRKKNRNKVQDLLSKEWPYLHQLVRRFTKPCQGMEFSDGHFLFCMQQIRNDHKSEQKSEEGLLLVTAKIAYVAACFQRKNPNSNAGDLALVCIYKMRKSFVDVPDEYHRFAYDLVQEVMMKGKKMPDEDRPDEDRPDEDRPDEDRPDEDRPDEDRPDEDRPDEDRPDEDKPDKDNSPLTPQDKKTIKKHLKKGCGKIEELIEKPIVKNWALDCSDDYFETCMDEILNKYKHEQANRDGFVRLCAKIAYAASYFIKKGTSSNAITLAVSRIREMARDSIHFKKSLDCKKLEYLIKGKFSFAYELVKTVVEMDPLPGVKFPDPENFILTDEFKRRIEEIPSKDGPELADLLKKHLRANGKRNTSDESFKACMDLVITKYKHESYTEEGFVLLCARLEHVKTCHFKMMDNLRCKALATSRINTIFRNLKLRGNLG